MTFPKISLSALNWVLATVFIFLFFLYPASDADLGWHYRYGEYFWSQGQILKTNTFSALLPDYRWPNHSWGYDALVYPLFESTAFFGLTLAASIIITLTFIVYHLKPDFGPGLAPAALIFAYFSQYLLNTGLRSQMLSLFFLALLWRLLQSRWRVKTLLWVTPLFFWLWANLHGQYLFGLGLVFISAVFDRRRWLMPLMASFLATLVNPFTYHLTLTAAEHLTAPTLQYIFEWMPWELYTLRMQLFLAFTLVFWWLYKITGGFNRTNRSETWSLVALSLLAIKARRLIPTFILTATSVIIPRVYRLPACRRCSRRTWLVLDTILLIPALVYTVSALPSRQLLRQSWTSYCRILACSVNLTDFINHNQLQGRFFTPYRLGGFLIYHTPQIKPYIDGRMVAWHENSHYPYTDYHTLTHNLPGAKDLFYQQAFHYVIAYRASEITPVLSDTEHWPVIYSDPLLVIFKNPFISPP